MPAVDWDIARARRNFTIVIILAGGLTVENVAAAGAATCDPYAVDVASGVELKPGKKDARETGGIFC